MRQLHDKVILISGGRAGIGAATARACVAAGMRVSLCARDLPGLEKTAAAIRADFPQAQLHLFAADVGSRAEVDAWVAAAMAQFGRLDAIYCNAGYGQLRTILETTEAEIRAMFETNYFGTINLLQAAMPHLRATPNGLKHILICASAAAKVGLPSYGHYSATKAAQDSVASALRAELAHEGFSVSCVYPTGTKTEFFTRSGSGGTSNTPAWMEQTADQVASAILKSLRNPKVEVWPHLLTRIGIALGVAFPGFAAAQMRNLFDKQKAQRPMQGKPQLP